jgi:radical SAM superfamily enzyme YgiQ (UPF0313 family)
MMSVLPRRPFRLTIVHPCVGRRPGEKRYVRTWQMEPLPAAMLASLAPADIEVRFFDDRLEPIPYDQPTDLVAISIETYTARRAYQIASEFRRRGAPVVMGGFHATLCPGEVAEHCESLVIGEAETLFPGVIDDYRHGRPQPIYRGTSRPPLTATPDRSIFRGKKYLPIRLVEFARGCRFHCDFCAIQTFFQATHSHRSVESVIGELRQVSRAKQMVFFIDDNLTSGMDEAKELMRALIPLKLRWVSQMAINGAFDEEALDLMRRSGCVGTLIGFESLDPPTLHQMNKQFNLMRGGAREAVANMRRFGLSVYGTFIFGYDHDSPDTVRAAVEFAHDEGLFIAAFNHITPFPGTPLYQRLASQGRLLFDAWWNDPRYRYNMIPFRPKTMGAEELARLCIDARRRFYSWSSIAQRGMHAVNRRDAFVARNFWAINAMHRWDISGRNGLPLGDANWRGQLLRVGCGEVPQEPVKL